MRRCSEVLLKLSKLVKTYLMSLYTHIYTGNIQRKFWQNACSYTTGKSYWRGKSWRINAYAKLHIWISLRKTLANSSWFAKFTNFSPTMHITTTWFSSILLHMQCIATMHQWHSQLRVYLDGHNLYALSSKILYALWLG